MKNNVLFITTDQQRQDSLPCYGVDFMKTPNLDWLADNGMVFNQSYVASPVCAPCRSTMMSGLFPSVSGTLSNDTWLPENIPVWPQLLSQEGYKTAAIGKMHFTPWDQMGGFDERIICEDKRHFYLPDDHMKFLEENGLDRPSPVDFPEYYETLGAPYYPHKKRFHPDVFIADQAAKWIGKNGDEPFAAWVSFLSPHDPYDPPMEMKDMYKECNIPEAIKGDVDANKMQETQLEYSRQMKRNSVFRIDPTEANSEQVRRWREHYYATISLVDEGIGKIIDVLREKGILKNTYIIFTSDHGDALGDHGLQAKYFFYESMVKVPLIVYGPNVPKGKTCDALVSTLNLMPTFLDIGQAHKPSTLQGKSLMEIINDPLQIINKYVFSEFMGHSMVYDGRYKYVHYASGGEELFDLQEDPEEIINASEEGSMLEIKARLRGKLIEHMLACQKSLKQRVTLAKHPARQKLDDEYEEYLLHKK